MEELVSNDVLVNVIIIPVVQAPQLAGSHADLTGPTRESRFLETLRTL